MGIERLSEFWPDWTVGELIGEGSYGKVYKAVRTDRFLTTEAAIKVIGIPRSNAEFEALRSEGMTVDESRNYLEGVVIDFVNEIKLMEALKNTPNVVSVEDYKILEKKDGVGWDIYIRMELLRSFRDHLEKNTLGKKDIIKLGIDIASALELCEKNNIIHRDIKPANIFISKNGDYKLGDFGVAKELSKTGGAMSSKGTFTYMAPEVAHGMKYDATVDIYSLGIVMYTLLNNNRLPFIDPHTPQVSYNDRLNANERRLSGEKLPAPCNADAMLSDVVLSACNYDPKLRFRTASAFKNALKACLSAGENISPVKPQGFVAPGSAHEADTLGDTVGVRMAPKTAVAVSTNKQNPSVKYSSPTTGTKKPKKPISIKKIVLLVLLVLLLVSGIWVVFNIDTVIDIVDDIKMEIEYIPVEKEYKRAQEYMDNGEYDMAAEIYRGMLNYKASSDNLNTCLEKIKKTTAKEQLAALNSSVQSGDIVKFGFCEQDDDLNNGMEEIEWIVLEKLDNNQALLISKYALAAKPFNNTETYVEWEYSTLKKWLNSSNGFMKDTFTEAQKSRIKSQNGSGQVRLLDSDEFKIYEIYSFFKAECAPSAYADYHGCHVDNGNCYWWLSSNGTGESAIQTVSPGGELEITGRMCNETMIGVRPVIVVSLG